MLFMQSYSGTGFKFKRKKKLFFAVLTPRRSGGINSWCPYPYCTPYAAFLLSEGLTMILSSGNQHVCKAQYG